MHRYLVQLATYVVATALFAVTAHAGSQQTDLGAATRRIFADKCTVCHGAELRRPRGRFGYVLDLQRIAENPEMVIPGDPEQSELWALVEHGEMPQPDSPQGPLSDEEKRTIKAWIAAGAPPPIEARKIAGPSVDRAAPPTSVESDEPATSVPIPGRGEIRLIGKLHLLVIHFPIALVVTALAAELSRTLRRGGGSPVITRFCLQLAAVSAVTAAALGWTYAASGAGASSPSLLTAHRWLGSATAMVIVITAALWRQASDNGPIRRGLKLSLYLSAAATIAAAHLGGLLVHGAEFFRY